MLSRILGVVTVATLLTLSGGCSHAPLSKTFNEANANNIVVQTVNPNAGKDESAPTTLDGKKSEGMLERYRADTGEVSKEALVKSVGK